MSSRLLWPMPARSLLFAALTVILLVASQVFAPSWAEAESPQEGPLGPLARQALEAQRDSSAAEAAAKNRYIVFLEDSVDRPGDVARAQVEGRGGRLGFVYRLAFKGYSAVLPEGTVEGLKRDPRVARVIPDRPVEALSQWRTPTGIDRAFATASSSLDIDGIDDVRVGAQVAVIDTGVDHEHPDLNVVGRINCLTGTIEKPVCVSGGVDGEGHGTHVAGTVGALDNGVGVVGVAPGAQITGVKVLTDDGNGWDSTVAAGIEWVTKTRQNESSSDDIDVANLSLGSLEPLEATAKAITDSVKAGVVYAVAAGNSDVNASGQYPANHPDVITVSALADSDGDSGGEGLSICWDDGPANYRPLSDDTNASFSNFGTTVEVAAPGVCILSTVPGGGYEVFSGTSMASPHVAGAAAILASKSHPKSKADVEAIRASIESEGNSNWDDTSGDGEKEPLLDVGNDVTSSTKAALPISSTEAKLRGLIHPGGVETKYQFEYGPTTSYGTKVPVSSESVGSGTAYVKVSKTISSLKPGVLYHFRIVATNSKGTFNSADRTFYTNLPTVSTDAAGRVTPTKAELSGTVDPESFDTRYHFEYGTTTSYGSKIPVDWIEKELGDGSHPISVARNIRGLEPEETYHFRLVASNAVGVAFGQDRTFMTPGASEIHVFESFGEFPCPKPTGCTMEGEGHFYSDLQTFFIPPSFCAHEFELTAKADGAVALADHEFSAVGEAWPMGCPMAPCAGEAEAWDGQILSYDGGVATATIDVCLKWTTGAGVLTKEGTVEIELGRADDQLLVYSRPPQFVGGFEFEGEWGTSEDLAMEGLPSAITRPVTNVNTPDATIKGVVNGNSPLGADLYFEYGTTTSYGTTVFPTGLVEGPDEWDDFAIKRTLTGLQPATTYHYRAVSENETGIAYGNDMTFTTSGWKTQTTLNPQAKVDARLEDTSCPSATVCLAVGSDNYGSGGMVEVWDGSTWKLIQSMPGAKLNAISCGSTSSCLITGRLFSSGEPRTWKMQYTEFLKTWSASSVTVPTPSGGSGVELEDVSCTSASACTAVGRYNASGYKPLALRWNGTAWSVQSVPLPSGEVGNTGFRGISCSGASECIAVGAYALKVSGTYRERPLAERWDGSAWSAMSPSHPSGATESQLLDVSCNSASACMATGRKLETAWKPFSEKWNGTSWSIVSTVTPGEASNAGEVMLGSLSCASASSCVAVGSYYLGSGLTSEKTLVEAWNGTEWTIKASPNPQTYSSLAGVSCSSTSACTAVGKSSASLFLGDVVTLAERWNGTEWSTQSTPNPEATLEARLDDTSCPTATACLAVGSDDYLNKGLVHAWNGTEWSLVQTLSDTALKGVSCESPTSCMIVGATRSTGDPRAWKAQYTEFFNTWSISSTSVPVPSGGTQVKFEDISCTWEGTCKAVGHYYAPGFRPLAMSWNGSAWTIDSTPYPSGEEGSGGELFGVSCGSQTACLAVGWKLKESERVPYALRLFDGEWFTRAPLEPEGATESKFEDVSCISPKACMVTGHYLEGGKEKVLVERWANAFFEWEIEPAPTVEAAKGPVELHGISCTSGIFQRGTTTADYHKPGICTAVGEYVSVMGEKFGLPMPTEIKTLVAIWDGTEWEVQSSPNPAGHEFSRLDGVSCSSAHLCTAVGRSTKGTETTTLGLRHE